MPVDVFLPLLPKVYSGPQRISPSSLVYHCVACVLVSLQKEGAAYARKGARPEPIAARAWRIGLGPIASATAQQKPRENGAFVTMDGYLNAGLWGDLLWRTPRDADGASDLSFELGVLFIGFGAGLAVTGCVEGAGEDFVGGAVEGVVLDGDFGGLEGLGDVLLHILEDGGVGEGDGVLWEVGDGLDEGGVGHVDFFEAQVGRSHVDEDVGVAGVEGEGVLVGVDGTGAESEGAQGIAEVDEGFDVVFHFDGFEQIDDGVFGEICLGVSQAADGQAFEGAALGVEDASGAFGAFFVTMRVEQVEGFGVW